MRHCVHQTSRSHISFIVTANLTSLFEIFCSPERPDRLRGAGVLGLRGVGAVGAGGSFPGGQVAGTKTARLV